MIIIPLSSHTWGGVYHVWCLSHLAPHTKQLKCACWAHFSCLTSPSPCPPAEHPKCAQSGHVLGVSHRTQQTHPQGHVCHVWRLSHSTLHVKHVKHALWGMFDVFDVFPPQPLLCNTQNVLFRHVFHVPKQGLIPFAIPHPPLS